MARQESVCDIRSGVALRFPDVDAIAVWHVLAYPAGDVFGRRVERHDIVQTGVVERLHDRALDVGEVGDHAVCIKFHGSAVYGYDPIVAVEAGALAFVVERKTVCGGYFNAFCDVIHGFDN